MTKSAEVFNGSLKRGVTRFKVCRVQSFSFSFCYKHLEPPGTAYNCISYRLGISSLLPTPPSIFTQSSSVALQKFSSQFSRFFSDLSVLWSDHNGFPISVSFRGESGPQGHRFRCCPRSLLRSSGETRQPFSQPVDACEPRVSASLLKPKKRWMQSLRSSHGPAMVAPYRVSLTPERFPSPRPVVLGVRKHDRKRRRKREGERAKCETRRKREWEIVMWKLSSRASISLGRFGRQDFDKDNAFLFH